MWELLIKRYWLVATLKESPANTPYSPMLLAMVTLVFFILVVFQWYLADLKQQFSLAISIVAALTLLCSYFVYTYVVLKIYRKTNRALQALTALLASHMIIHIFAFPLLVAAPLLVSSGLNQALLLFIGFVYLILTLVLTIWQFLVTVHIYKHAMDLDYLSAVVASFGLLACNILTVSFWQ
jgi:hypothetical protein